MTTINVMVLEIKYLISILSILDMLNLHMFQQLKKLLKHKINIKYKFLSYTKLREK